MAIRNDTVRLKVQFKTFTGIKVEPIDIRLVIYDKQRVEVTEVLQDDLIKEDTGKYYYDYVVSDELLEYFYFEFGGIHNNKPILSRGKVDIQFNK